MPKNDYTAAEALKLLLEKVAKAEPLLVDRIRHAIDAGKDVQEQQTTGKSRKRARTYRKHVAYSDEEALLVALRVLRAHFFELPVIVNAAFDAFRDTYLGAKKLNRFAVPSFEEDWAEDTSSYGQEKMLEIEIETEATLVKDQLKNLSLVRYAESEIDQVRERLESLYDLLTFGGMNGDSSGS